MRLSFRNPGVPNFHFHWKSFWPNRKIGKFRSTKISEMAIIVRNGCIMMHDYFREITNITMFKGLFLEMTFMWKANFLKGWNQKKLNRRSQKCPYRPIWSVQPQTRAWRKKEEDELKLSFDFGLSSELQKNNDVGQTRRISEVHLAPPCKVRQFNLNLLARSKPSLEVVTIKVGL